MENYISLENAKNLGFELSTYQQRDLDKDLKDLETFKPMCKLIPLTKHNIFEGVNYFEHIIVYIEFNGILLKPYKRYNEKIDKIAYL